MPDNLTLSRALSSNALAAFVDQAEAEGIGPADRAQFDKMLERVIAPQPEVQTSHSPVGDCSPET
jgi:hypothetical protein